MAGEVRFIRILEGDIDGFGFVGDVISVVRVDFIVFGSVGACVDVVGEGEVYGRFRLVYG